MGWISDFRHCFAAVALAVVAAPTALAQTRESVRPADAYQKLDSLEHAALGSATFAERLSAVSTITRIGMYATPCDAATVPAPVQYSGLVARLRSVYRQSTDPSLRLAIVSGMLWHRECEEVARFLSEVAVEEPTPRPSGGVIVDELRPSPQAMAISVLTQFGPPGEAAIRQLLAAGTVREPDARRQLEEIERRMKGRAPR